MIILSENFDQISDISDLVEMFGYTIHSSAVLASTDSFFTSLTTTPLALGDQGKRFLYCCPPLLNATLITTPTLTQSRRLVFGIAIGCGYKRNGNLSQTPESEIGLNAATLQIRFRNSTTNLFAIKIFFRQAGTIDITFDNYNSSLTNPTSANGIPANRYRKNFFEFYSDSDGAEGSFGTVKVAMNGRTIVTRENVINSNYAEWGGDPYSAGSYYNNIVVDVGYHAIDPDTFAYSTYKKHWAIDSFYICNEASGYHDDFLGPVHISTFYPDPEHIGDTNNWAGFQGGVKVSDPSTVPNASLVDTPVIDATAPDVDYIEADSEYLRELYYFNDTLDPVRNLLNNPIAVNFRTFVKNIFSYGSANFDKGLVAIAKVSGNDVSRETDKKVAVNQFTYKPLDVYYGVMPVLAIPWTWEFLDLTQFGMDSTQLIHQVFVEDAMDATDEVTEE